MTDWGPLAALIHDSRVQAIQVSGPADVYAFYTTSLVWERVEGVAFESAEDIARWVNTWQREVVLSEMHPAISVQLPGRLWLRAVMPSAAGGAMLTIRRGNGHEH